MKLDAFRHALALALLKGAYVPDMEVYFPVPPVCTARWQPEDWARTIVATTAFEFH